MDDNYACEGLGEGRFVVYKFLENFREDAACFTLHKDGTYTVSIYEKFKGIGLGYTIKLFIDDIKSNQEKQHD